MEKLDAKVLLEKYRSGRCTLEERAIVEHYVIQRGITPFDLMEMQTDIEELRNRIVKMPVRSKIVNLPLRIAGMAAAIVMFISIAVLMLKKEAPISVIYANDIFPGGNKATLTLANGKTINLSDAKTGIVIDGDNVSYNDGESVEKINNNFLSRQGGSLPEGERKVTVTTPLGGIYQITLPDGSKVWLNSASSLTYRASLNKRGEDRIVTLSGEAYFEIFTDKKHPFIVKTKLQEVEVLGTHFNISAYADENVVKTTLVEGSVKVAPLSLKGERKEGNPEGVTLKPNQQSVITVNNPIKVEEVDVNTAVAWKNGEFSFRNEPLESIMRKVARWYNVEVVYENKELASIPFGGSISRFGKVSEVLFMLQQTGKVKFKIEGRMVTVN